MATYDLLAGLPLNVESYSLEGLEYERPDGGFTRLSTVIKLRGDGEEGIGEDVDYDAVDHVALQEAGAVLQLAGERTLGEACELIGSLDLFPAPPVRDVSRLYRRWAFESAALDLALRQAGKSLHEALGREPAPVNFVVSMRLGTDERPSSIEPLRARLEHYPTLRFKLDPTNDWTDELIAELAGTGAVDSLDLKGQYRGTVVDVETDPELYLKCLEAFPDAWIEDPDVNDATRPVLEPYRDRITWDAPIHSIADVEALEWKPRMVNIKPSRFGSLEALCAGYDYCDAEGIGAYGGGQWELGCGRGQIQYLASVFHPDTPNDVAPSGFNSQELATKPGLPASPLAPAPAPIGFRWDSGGGLG
jgi:L-alanine-DL-glutamate epimerase-like enolase superfamily enzyme